MFFFLFSLIRSFLVCSSSLVLYLNNYTLLSLFALVMIVYFSVFFEKTSEMNSSFTADQLLIIPLPSDVDANLNVVTFCYFSFSFT